MWSRNELEMVQKVGYDYQSRVWDNWSEDPTKVAAIQAIRSCQARVGYDYRFGQEVAMGLAQILVCFLHSCLLEVEEVHY